MKADCIISTAQREVKAKSSVKMWNKVNGLDAKRKEDVENRRLKEDGEPVWLTAAMSYAGHMGPTTHN